MGVKPPLASDQGPDGRFVKGNTAAIVHGLTPREEHPMLRALLTEDEQQVWDSAPVPVGAAAAVELVIRHQHVQRFRVEKYLNWQTAAIPDPDVGERVPTGQVLGILEAGEKPDRVTLKAIEVHARLEESESARLKDDTIQRYLQVLTAQGLTDLLRSMDDPDAELPLLDPRTGLPIAQVGPAVPVGDPH